ncbi:MAG TPA: helix-turn-helix transcriptional regulator [Sphingobium sp.]|uniref:helix-turn-helix domain-containing protein n=1 Tax=Sphingobium sp. TaxID=1912891 RepID=UPI002ED2B864
MAAIETERNRRAAKIGIAQERYAGWLDVRRTIVGAFDSYRTECLVDFNGGWAELRRFAWSAPIESIWHTGERCYFLSLSLDGAPETNRSNVELALAMPDGGRRVLLVPPEQTISSICRTGGQRRSLRCLIDADFVESICSFKPTREERAQIGAADFSGGTIEWLLLRMYREICHAEVGMKIAVESIAREIAVEIARAVERRRSNTRRRMGGLPSWRMRLILDRIHAEGPLPRVSDLAILSGMTVRHLGRAFQTEMGKTLGKFIAAAMVERASRMLEAGMPVGAVAATLGYASSSSFAHAFHRETGILPSSVRDGERHRGAPGTGAASALRQ